MMTAENEELWIPYFGSAYFKNVPVSSLLFKEIMDCSMPELTKNPCLLPYKFVRVYEEEIETDQSKRFKNFLLPSPNRCHLKGKPLVYICAICTSVFVHC